MRTSPTRPICVCHGSSVDENLRENDDSDNQQRNNGGDDLKTALVQASYRKASDDGKCREEDRDNPPERLKPGSAGVIQGVTEQALGARVGGECNGR